MELLINPDPSERRLCGTPHPKREGVTCDKYADECLGGVHSATIENSEQYISVNSRSGADEVPTHRKITFCTNKTSTGASAMAVSLADLISEKEIERIKKMSKELNLDVNEVSLKLFNLEYTELSHAGADDVINELHNLGAHLPKGKLLKFKKPENRLS